MRLLRKGSANHSSTERRGTNALELIIIEALQKHAKRGNSQRFEKDLPKFEYRSE
jgi:hypothetical protein